MAIRGRDLANLFIPARRLVIAQNSVFDRFCAFAAQSLSLSLSFVIKDKQQVTADKTKQQVFADQATGARSEDTSSK
jgi:hypothetical protein